MVHYTYGAALGSGMRRLCAVASIICFKSLTFGYDGILYILIPPPSFTSPLVGLSLGVFGKLFLDVLQTLLNPFKYIYDGSDLKTYLMMR